MEIGDAVQVVNEPGDVTIIGWITAIEGDTISFTEAHAFHRLWGGSGGMRGEKHTHLASDVKPCFAPWQHIVREQRDKAQKASVEV